MNGFAWFLAGFLIGGLFIAGMICCLQLHRTNQQEADPQGLRV